MQVYHLIRNLLVFMVMLMPTMTVAAPEQWKLVKDHEDIKAYTKHVEGTNNLAFRGEAVMKGTVDELVSIHRDVNSMSYWLHSCYEPKIIEDETEQSRVIHMKNSVPAIVRLFVTDRDLVLRQTIQEHTPTHAYIKLVGMQDRLPKVKGFVRVASFDGYWQFTQVSSDVVKVEYEGIIDPSGLLPSTATNRFVVDTPYESLRKLRAYLHKQARPL